MATDRGTVFGMPGARNVEEAYRMYDEQYWKPERPRPSSGPRGGCLFAALGFVISAAVLSLFFLWCMLDMTQGAEMKAYRCTPAQAEAGECLPIIGYRSGNINKFGTYSDEYYDRRWKRMCEGPARYDAMREANDRGRPMPCVR